MVKHFFSLRKLSSVGIETGICSRQDAKHAKSGSSILCDLCAFARDIPSFDCGFAALGLCDEHFFTGNPK
jgi:hypothetical protein